MPNHYAAPAEQSSLYSVVAEEGEKDSEREQRGES